MGRLKTLARMFRNFPTNNVAEPDVPAAPDGADGYAKSTKIALLLLKK
jgi:IS5 family transposase